MKRLMMCGLVGSVAAVGIVLTINRTEPTSPAATGCVAPAAATTVERSPVPPVVLSKVVETIDLDLLLDPAEKPLTGEPFEADVPAVTTSDPPATAVPDRIPPAAEDRPAGK